MNLEDKLPANRWPWPGIGSARVGRPAELIVAALVVLVLIPAVPRAAEPGELHVTFSAEQALGGKSVFAEHCSSCHGTNLQGISGPPMKGSGFAGRWLTGQETVGDLLETVQRSMPLNAPHSLAEDQYQEVVAYILAANGFEGASKPLSAANTNAIMQPRSTSTAHSTAFPSRSSFPQLPVREGTASTNKPDDEELVHADDADWLMYNKSYNGQRFSGLDQITAANAARLQPKCLFQPSEIGGFQAAPVVYDGLMYVTSPYNTFAINPASCAKVWEHRYPEDLAVPVIAVSRGVAIYRGKLLRTTPDGHLLALDAKTGKMLWDVWIAGKHFGYWLSGAPIAHDGMVFMGTAGADWGANGEIYAFDAETGNKVWTFNVIPTGREAGAESWQMGAERGGGAFWSTFTFDVATNLLLVSTGNPAPSFNGAMRPGSNLYTDSVVALDAKTGKLAWWVQQIPHDVHDWDTAAAPVIYDQNGRTYLGVASKDGWLYRYDRASHKLLGRSEISSHVNADAPITPSGVYHCPGPVGGAEWNGAAYSPIVKALFINSVDWCGTTRLTEDRYIQGSAYYDGNFTWDAPEKSRGYTRAFDAASGKPLWSRTFETPMVAAITATAGGVLFTGSLDGSFLALDALSGRTLFKFNTGGAVAGAPSTYLINGTQYVAIASGNNSRTIWRTGGAMMIAVFSLQGD